MLGCSMGAAIGLHVAAEHPEQLGTLIAHEPVAPWLLPGDERARHVRELEEVQEVFLARGWKAALAPMAATLGIDPRNQEREPDAVLPPLDERRAANFAFFLGQDFTAVRADDVDQDLLRKTSARVVPAVGATTPRGVFDRRCAELLGELLDAEVEEFPGGHNGSMTHPSGYAARIREIVDWSVG